MQLVAPDFFSDAIKTYIFEWINVKKNENKEHDRLMRFTTSLQILSVPIILPNFSFDANSTSASRVVGKIVAFSIQSSYFMLMVVFYMTSCEEKSSPHTIHLATINR